MRIVAGIACGAIGYVHRAYQSRSSDNDAKATNPTPRKEQRLHEQILAYLGLGTSAAIGINPDVLSLDGTTLVKRHVLHELNTPWEVSIEHFLSGLIAIVEIQSNKNQTHILRVGDDS